MQLSVTSQIIGYFRLYSYCFIILGGFYNRERLKNYRLYSLVILSFLFVFIVLHAVSYLLPRDAPLHPLNNSYILVDEGNAKFYVFNLTERIMGTHSGSDLLTFRKMQILRFSFPRTFHSIMWISLLSVLPYLKIQTRLIPKN